MTYLNLINSVLRRLREEETTSVTSTTYVKMVGDFVNDAKTLVGQGGRLVCTTRNTHDLDDRFGQHLFTNGWWRQRKSHVDAQRYSKLLYELSNQRLV